MSFVVVIVGFAAAIVLLVGRALAVDEIKGRIQRHITASLDATIDLLPDELRAEWADEWRAELAAVITMPLTAAQLVHGLRHSAHELLAHPALALAGTTNHAPTSQRVGAGLSTKRAQRVWAGVSNTARGGLAYLTRDIALLVAVVGAAVAAVVLVAVVGGAVGSSSTSSPCSSSSAVGERGSLPTRTAESDRGLRTGRSSPRRRLPQGRAVVGRGGPRQPLEPFAVTAGFAARRAASVG